MIYARHGWTESSLSLPTHFLNRQVLFSPESSPTALPFRLLVLVDQTGPRLTYTLEWTLRVRLGIQFAIQEINSTNPDASARHVPHDSWSDPVSPIPPKQEFDGVLYYGGGVVEGEVPTLIAEGLLQETGIRPYAENNQGPPWTGSMKRVDADGGAFPAMFPTEHELGHDPLAGIFWMLSRYEEYQRPERDRLGRFPVTASWLAREGVLEMPLADYYVRQLGKWLTRQYAGYSVPDPLRVVQPTVDVDLCYSYLGKSLYRQIGGWCKDIFQGRWRDAVLRIRVLMGLDYDPYDRYAALQDLHRRWEAASSWCKRPIYFFLMADYGGLDRGHSPQSPYLRRVIRFLTHTGAQIGWHPSIQSNTDDPCAALEKKTLENLVGQVPTSRQHYLALSLPLQARRLQGMGIQGEYSLGYAERPGFKAGTFHPFGFYDLGQEQELPLRMFPVPIMDATLQHHLQLDPDGAWAKVQPLLKAWEEYGGFFTLLWHNSTIDIALDASKNQDRWQAFYQKCYEKVLNLDTKAIECTATDEQLEGSWAVRDLTEAEREGWDLALPPAVSVYHCRAYLDHRLGRQWSLLLSPNQRWAMPVPGRLAGWALTLRQPLMVQYYQLLRVEYREGQVLPSSEPEVPGQQVYASLIKSLDRRYLWVDWQLDCREVPGSLVDWCPSPRWNWVSKPSYIIRIESSAEVQWTAYRDHHRRYLRNASASESIRRYGWELKVCTSWNQALTQQGLEHCLDQALQRKAGWNQSKIHQAKDLIRTMLSKQRGTLCLLHQGETFLAAAVLWHSGPTLVYQWAWDSPQGHSARASMHLVHRILEWARAQCNANGQPIYQFLDMEGSEIPGLQRFYAGFGGKPRSYWRIIKHPMMAKS